MNYLFTHAPLLVAGHDKSAYTANYGLELERRAAEIREKGDGQRVHEERIEGVNGV